MAQVGHHDSKVTLEIYARVLKRRDREQIGLAFDDLLIGRTATDPRLDDSADTHSELRSVGSSSRPRAR